MSAHVWREIYDGNPHDDDNDDDDEIGGGGGSQTNDDLCKGRGGQLFNNYSPRAK